MLGRSLHGEYYDDGGSIFHVTHFGDNNDEYNRYAGRCSAGDA